MYLTNSRCIGLTVRTKVIVSECTVKIFPVAWCGAGGDGVGGRGGGGKQGEAVILH